MNQQGCCKSVTQTHGIEGKKTPCQDCRKWGRREGGRKEAEGGSEWESAAGEVTQHFSTQYQTQRDFSMCTPKEKWKE